MRNTRLKELLAATPVVITGMGAITSAGAGVKALWKGVIEGKGLAQSLGLRKPESLQAMVGCRVAEPVMLPGSGALLSKADRSAQLAVRAAAEALQQAGLDGRQMPSDRIAIVAGTSRGPVGKLGDAMKRAESGRVLPSQAASSTISALSGTLSVHFGIRGPALTVSTACASAATAIALGAELLLLGNADAVLVGGAEAPLHPLILSQLSAAGVLGVGDDPTTICRPFDRSREGTVLGEGAAFLVLELEANARRRGVVPLACLKGWAVGAEGEQRAGINANADALVAVLKSALDTADISVNDVDYINAHGTGTRMNDRQESLAILRVFGEERNCIACSSIKPVVGHCMGASGAIEAVVCVEVLRHQLAPPTANWHHPDLECPVDVVSGQARKISARNVISNSCGFWGNNGVLVFSSV